MTLLDATAPAVNAVVHAAAGTGKTWLLTTRIVRLLLAGAAPGSILAVTFTKKAAADIKDRLHQRLRALAAADDAGVIEQLHAMGLNATIAERDAARNLYENILRGVYDLRATTFHAFCHELLQRFPLEAGIAVGFELLENTTVWTAEAWRAFDRELTRQPNSAVAQAMDLLLRNCRGLSNTRKALYDFLNHRSDWWAYTETMSDPVADAIERLRTLFGVTGSEDPAAELLADASVRAYATQFCDQLRRHPGKTHDAWAQKIAHAYAPDTTADAACNLLCAAFFTDKDEPRVIRESKTLVDKLGADGVQTLLRARDAIVERLRIAVDRRLRVRNFTTLCAWYTCGAHLLDRFQRLKQRQRALDFADLEWIAYRLLNTGRHAHWIQYKLDSRIDHLLVDEFQDTNPTQWRLLLPLLHEIGAGDAGRSRSVFLVGDEKQSIYRFRRGDPLLFHAAHAWLTQHARAQSHIQHASWRSSPAILHFVNLIFADADVAGYPLVNFVPHTPQHAQMWGQVELLPLARKGELTAVRASVLRDPLTAPRACEEDQRRGEEGRTIAAKILEIIGQPIGADADARPLAYGDIMILLRYRTQSAAYEAALRAAGIPYIGASRGQFTTCLEVRDVMHLLTVLVAPFDNLAFASALRSPIFSATEEDLIVLAAATTGHSWYERLEQLPADALAAHPALARARPLLSQWQELSDRIPVHDLVDRIYCDGDVVARYVGAAPPHLKTRVVANLNRLLTAALDLDSGRFPSLAQFRERLEQLTEDETEATAAHGGDAVRVLTIHAAKGLESPVVFLADAASDRSRRGRGIRALVEWPVDEPRPTLFHLLGAAQSRDDVTRAAAVRAETAERREDANLLYVAMTRAKQMLFVSACEPTRGGDHGWYGYLAERMARAAESETGLPGVRWWNSGLEFGTPPTLPTASPVTVDPAFALDPALTRPLASRKMETEVNPSAMVAHAIDRTGARLGEDIYTRGVRGRMLHRILELLSVSDAPYFDRDAKVGARIARRDELETRVAAEFDLVAMSAWFEPAFNEAWGVITHPDFRDYYDSTRYDTARTEVPILYVNEGRSIYGVIDRLIARRGEIVLLDYKTHAHATRENVALLAQTFAPQMRLYVDGVRRLWPGKPVRALLLFTACCVTHELE